MKIMTMDQFLKNPSGSYSASFARRDLIIANLEDRFTKLYSKRKKDFKLIIFQGKNKNDINFYFKIPSEEIPELLYDVILSFIPTDMSCLTSNNIKKYAIKVFSNSPNFHFTYAYWYNKDGIIIDELKDKVSNTALTQEPVIKNAEGIYGFEKSVYFALLYIKYNNLTYKSTISSFFQNNYTILKLKPKIQSCSAKMIEYTKLKNKAKNIKKETNKSNNKSQKGGKKFSF